MSPDETDPNTRQHATADDTVIVVMGVSGVGKTTVAQKLAALLDWPFEEGDTLHPAANIAKMRAGRPLSDEDREPWLEAVAAWIDGRSAQKQPGIITCSALKRSYRQVIVGGRPNVRIVYLRGDRSLIADRLAGRRDHFMPPILLQSQFDALEEPEPDENALVVDARLPAREIAEEIVRRLGPTTPPPLYGLRAPSR